MNATESRDTDAEDQDDAPHPPGRLRSFGATAFSMIAAAMVFGAWKNGAIRGGWGELIGWILPAAVCGTIARALAAAQARRDQRYRDLSAGQWDKARSELAASGPFSLYIRPFAITGQLQTRDAAHAAGPLASDHWTRTATLDFEKRLIESRRCVPIVALGEPGEAIGAGRIKTTDAAWQQEFTELARRAQHILAVPSDRPGTRWELEWLKAERLLSKTVFLMPPSDAYSDVDIQQLWTATGLSLRGTLEIPGYQKAGALFTCAENGAVRSVARLCLDQSSLESALRGESAEPTGWVRHWGKVAAVCLALIAVTVWLLLPNPPPRFEPQYWEEDYRQGRSQIQRVAITVTVHGEAFVLPMPPGWYRKEGPSQESDGRLRLAELAPSGSLWRSHPSDGARAFVQTYVDGQRGTGEEFERSRQEVRRAQRKSNTFDLTTSPPSTIQIIDEGDAFLAWMLDYQPQSPMIGRPRELAWASTQVEFLVRNRLVVLTVNTTHRGESLAWLYGFTRAWLHEVRQSNGVK